LSETVKVSWPSCRPTCPLMYLRPVLEYCAVAWHHDLSKNQSRLRQSRDELCASFVPLQHLHPIGWHSTMLDFCLFPTDVTNSVGISFRKCVIHPVASTISCYQPVTPTSPLSSEEHPYTLDLVIEPTVNKSFKKDIHPPCCFKIPIDLYHCYFISTLPTIS